MKGRIRVEAGGQCFWPVRTLKRAPFRQVISLNLISMVYRLCTDGRMKSSGPRCWEAVSHFAAFL